MSTMKFSRHRLLQDFQAEVISGNHVYICHLHDRLVQDWLSEYRFSSDSCQWSSPSAAAKGDLAQELLLPASLLCEMAMAASQRFAQKKTQSSKLLALHAAYRCLLHLHDRTSFPAVAAVDQSQWRVLTLVWM